MPSVSGFGWVSFLSDFGTDDGFVAACHGVIAGIAPAVRVIDVSHGVPARDVRTGATLLAQVVGQLPRAVHLAVVDPGVGTARRAVALATPRGFLVGPDNGLLIAAAEALGGVGSAHELTEARLHRSVVSATFHGRDVFAPVAAHLARGLPLPEVGRAVQPVSLARLPPPRLEISDGALVSEVVLVDRFGNLQLAAGPAELTAAGLARATTLAVAAEATAQPVAAEATAQPVVAEATTLPVVAASDEHPAVSGRTFGVAAPGALVVYVDSAGRLAVAVNGASAARLLGAGTGSVVRLTRR
jgi:S-adenosylmethionine hydrolase